MPDVTQKIVELDKDNVYYKQTNRNLKRKLREMINTFETEKQVWYCFGTLCIQVNTCLGLMPLSKTVCGIVCFIELIKLLLMRSFCNQVGNN